MEYSVEVYSKNEKIKSYFLRFSQYMFLFWVPQSGMSSRVIDVFFDNEKCVLKEGKVGLSLNGIKDISVLVGGINIFRQVMKTDQNNMSLCFIPYNDIERELSLNLGKMLGIIYTIDDSNYKRNVELFDGNKVDEGLDNKDRVVYLVGSEIQDNNGNVIGSVNQGGYSVNFENNSIERNGEFIGFIGDKSFKVQGGPGITKVKRTGYAVPASRMGGFVSSEPSGPIRNKGNAAFVSLPVIMFVLSAMLLVASLILLFVLD